MNAGNTIVYVKITGKARDGFIDPPKFHWDLEKDKKLWATISKFGDSKKSIDWTKLSREFQAPEYFLRKRSYRLFAKHLKLLEQEIETKTRGLTVNSNVSRDGTYEPRERDDHDDSERSYINPRERGNTATPEGLYNLRSSQILNQKVPGDTKGTESSLSELSNLSVSKSALEEALLDRLQL
ncbi:LADA_0C06480g1_1 [Lachancea dasiensis]|uniref:Autophagy-related protein 29 n=1 Tax=Lachancea dasiensis TaxID=1072105 RepID=A0A1G4IZF4_9SACH|nr:LADA_0C06480g1_1 [Lachancea dasiensis]